MGRMEADAVTPAVSNICLFDIDENKQIPSGSRERGEHKIVIHGIPVRSCILLRIASINYTRGISLKVNKTVYKKSD